MSAHVILLLALWTLCEAAGQIMFKHGTNALDTSGEAHFGLKTLRRALRSPVIWGGVLVHGVEFVVWIEILGLLPLSVAFPLESVSYVTVLAATRVLLREVISTRRWIGVGLICAGITVLGVAS
jgi:multidrug transporter EmrE-like cation transporter